MPTIREAVFWWWYSLTSNIRTDYAHRFTRVHVLRLLTSARWIKAQYFIIHILSFLLHSVTKFTTHRFVSLIFFCLFLLSLSLSTCPFRPLFNSLPSVCIRNSCSYNAIRSHRIFRYSQRDAWNMNKYLSFSEPTYFHLNRQYRFLFLCIHRPCRR